MTTDVAPYGVADFLGDDDDSPGIPWQSFVTALGVWHFRQERSTTVAEAMLAFNVTQEAVTSAIADHPWLFADWTDGVTDPRLQSFESDGE